jgi:4-carboxymuconolactone decarboxylase
MVEVYGTTFGTSEESIANAPPVLKPLIEETVDQVFAVWDRSELSIRDRRLVTMGITAALGRDELFELQLIGALKNGELDETQIGEMILHIAYYLGWPLASRAIAGAQRAVAAAAGDAT